MTKIKIFFNTFIFIFIFSVTAQAGEIVSRIQQNGFVRCGARTFPKAYAFQTETGDWSGMDAEMCRAIASAILNNPDAVRIVPVNKEDGFYRLHRGEIDLLMANIPWTMQTEIVQDVVFPAPFYYSALGFAGHIVPDASSMKSYADKKVCVEASSFLTSSLDSYNLRYGLNLRMLKMPDLAKAKELFYMKRCDLLFDRIEVLKSDYFQNPPTGVQISVLPEVVHSYPTGPFISGKDKDFYEIVRWTIYALIVAEKKGINLQNIEDFENTEDEEIRDFLDENVDISRKLGVASKFPSRVISQVGNYADIYKRSFGEKGKVDLPRTVNRLKQDGGLIDAPSFRK